MKNKAKSKRVKTDSISHLWPLPALILLLLCLFVVSQLFSTSETSIDKKESPVEQTAEPFEVKKISTNDEEKSAFIKSSAFRDTATIKGFVSPEDKLSTAKNNLMCAVGLAGSEDLNIDECLRTLEEWAEKVRVETEKYLYRYKADPAEYYNSEAYYRILTLTTVLQQDYRIKYNPDLIDLHVTLEDLKKPFTHNSKDVFIHGLLTGNHTGTCSSMPVLVLAIGRILGYPLSLVMTKAHLFLRWEDAREKINIEATSKGLLVGTDDNYRQWPFPISPEEERSCLYLKSLTPHEENAVYLQIRADMFMAWGNKPEALRLYEKVDEMIPNNAFIQRQIDGLKTNLALEAIGMQGIKKDAFRQTRQKVVDMVQQEKQDLETATIDEARRIHQEFVSKTSNPNDFSNHGDSYLKMTQALNKLQQDKLKKQFELNSLQGRIMSADNDAELNAMMLPRGGYPVSPIDQKVREADAINRGNELRRQQLVPAYLREPQNNYRNNMQPGGRR